MGEKTSFCLFVTAWSKNVKMVIPDQIVSALCLPEGAGKCLQVEHEYCAGFSLSSCSRVAPVFLLGTILTVATRYVELGAQEQFVVVFWSGGHAKFAIHALCPKLCSNLMILLHPVGSHGVDRLVLHKNLSITGIHSWLAQWSSTFPNIELQAHERTPPDIRIK